MLHRLFGRVMHHISFSSLNARSACELRPDALVGVGAKGQAFVSSSISSFCDLEFERKLFAAAIDFQTDERA